MKVEPTQPAQPVATPVRNDLKKTPEQIDDVDVAETHATEPSASQGHAAEPAPDSKDLQVAIPDAKDTEGADGPKGDDNGSGVPKVELSRKARAHGHKDLIYIVQSISNIYYT